MRLKALIFDCDGVLADTERDGHRVAFNGAFKNNGVDAEWDAELYGKLLHVAGGKERLRHFFGQSGWPAEAENDRDGFIQRLHADKSRIYRELVSNGSLPLRPGIERIVDEAHAAGLRLAVCSTASEDSVSSVLDLLGQQRKPWFRPVLASEAVRHKKPDPEVYLLALQRLALGPEECLVIEDSRMGMLAALAAGIRCVITTSTYTAGEDFCGASLVIEDLGDPPHACLALADLASIGRQ